MQKTPSSAERPSALKRAMSGFMKKTSIQPLTQLDGGNLSSISPSDPISSREHRRESVRRMSGTINSSPTTRSNSPPSPSSPADGKSRPPSQAGEPTHADFFANSRKKNRSSTGFGLRDKFSSSKNRHSGSNEKDSLQQARRSSRATSVDLESAPLEIAPPVDANGAQLPAREIWPTIAEIGTGVKARRMSLSLPDDFVVEVGDLYSEYSDQNKLGLRGKTLGKGATANVRLVIRKGHSSELYAAKEFRKMSTKEENEEYEKKVKSEYTIAKSLHHPNIVETYRLCTHNDRFTQVMEFCSEGDMFNLVSQKYLSKEDHLVDRVCFFKQLVQGLNYLHKNGIAHRDVKLENILITKDSKLKITDFGVSEVFAGQHPGLRSAGGQCGKEMGEVRLCAPGMCGSAPYVAPEVIARIDEYDPRPLDVWGAAIVMLCMTANGVLWQEAKPGSSPRYDDLVRGWEKWNGKHVEDATITEMDYPNVSFLDRCINPPALRRLLLTMLNPNPVKRASMAAVAKNRWLKNAECCQPNSNDDPAQTIDASKSRTNLKNLVKVVHHNHLPPHQHFGHKLVRLPGSTDM
ncbi:Pkinase-domain-containing protein [Mollisia scopiformis]|uniref:Pkinase-domain-containing protein n=1 Tax=Mollisia scopiformis TaxID=149040 RepID=A0A132B7Z7_MOLSC|nr:Pkinase-domain-containing protein [Mollisia scopiformis]KUJ08373.1 Pkinase-domain-containing protein [Mollisia scopiformis]